MISTLNSKGLVQGVAGYLTRFRRHPWRVFISVVVFGLVWYSSTISVALFGAVLLLALLLDLPPWPFLLAAIIALALTPALYFLDRPAQAERVGVLVFSLLALGTIVNLADTWRRRMTTLL